ncbi:MAG: hypothetical protein U0X91_01650 [Spirosomataceae bacterium]
MDQDFLYKNVFFGGFYAVAFGLVYLSGRKAGPKLAIGLTVACWSGLMLIMWTVSGTVSFMLLVPVLLILLVVFRKRIEAGFQPFYTENKIFRSSNIPAPVLERLGDRNWSCSEGTFLTETGKTIHFYWWEGWYKSTTYSNNTQLTAFHHSLAVSFAPNTVDEFFKQKARSAMDTSHFTFRQRVKRFFVLDTETPYLVDETADGSFVIAWNTHLDADYYTKRLHWLKQHLTLPTHSL